jgi:hypothetical protein
VILCHATATLRGCDSFVVAVVWTLHRATGEPPAARLFQPGWDPGGAGANDREVVTEDRLAINLITVNLYEVVVPQRVDPEHLVTIYNKNGAAIIQLFRSVFERLAPKSLPQVEKLVSPGTVGQGTNVRVVTDGLLACLTDAYRESSPPRASCPPFPPPL